MGLLILGWVMIVVAVILGLMGAFSFPVGKWAQPEFLSMLVSALVLLAGGMAVIKAASWMTILAIILAAVSLIVYAWSLKMDLGPTIISYVIIIALAGWLISLFF